MIKKLNKVIFGQEKLKVVLSDSNGNSAIISDKVTKKRLKWGKIKMSGSDIEAIYKRDGNKLHAAMSGDTERQIHSYIENLARAVEGHERKETDEGKKLIHKRFVELREAFLRDATNKQVVEEFIAAIQLIIK